jgi:putative endonuclease
MFIVYALISQSHNWIYVGFSSNLENRILRHNSGHERTTAPYRPFICMELSVAFNRVEARRIEKWYKTASGKNCIRQIAQSY